MSFSLLQSNGTFRKRKITDICIRKDRTQQPPVKRVRHLYATTLSFDRFMDVDPVRPEFTQFRDGKAGQKKLICEDAVSLGECLIAKISNKGKVYSSLSNTSK